MCFISQEQFSSGIEKQKLSTLFCIYMDECKSYRAAEQYIPSGYIHDAAELSLLISVIQYHEMLVKGSTVVKEKNQKVSSSLQYLLKKQTNNS